MENGRITAFEIVIGHFLVRIPYINHRKAPTLSAMYIEKSIAVAGAGYSFHTEIAPGMYDPVVSIPPIYPIHSVNLLFSTVRPPKSELHHIYHTNCIKSNYSIITTCIV